MNVRFSFKIFMVAFFFFNAGSTPIDAGELIIRTADYPPFYFLNFQKKWDGIEVDIVKEMLKQAGITDYQFRKIPWKRALLQMEIGKCDIMMALSKTAEREEFINFIGVSRYEQMCLAVRKENKKLLIREIDDFKTFDKKLGIQADVYYKGITERLKTDPEFAKQIDEVTRSELNFRKTAINRIIGFFEEKSYITYLIKTDPEFKDISLHGFCITDPAPVYIGVSKKTNPAVQRRLEAAFGKIEQKGMIEAIYRKWIGLDM